MKISFDFSHIACFLLTFAIVNLRFVYSQNFNSKNLNGCSTGGTSDNKLEVNRFSFNVDSDNKLEIQLSATSLDTLDQVQLTLTFRILGSSFSLPTIPICQIGAVSCPIEPKPFEFQLQIDAPQQLTQVLKTTNSIPGAGFDVIIELSGEGSSGKVQTCAQSTVSETASTRQSAITYTSVGIFVSVGTLNAFSGFLNLLTSSSGKSSRPGSVPNLLDILNTFHFISSTGLLSVSYPAAYDQFTQNFGWSQGLIYIKSMQEAFDRVHGTPNLKRRSSASLKTNRHQLARRTELTEYFLENNAVASFTRKLNIKPQNFFLTALSIFLIVFVVVTVLLILLRLILEALSYAKPTIFHNLRNHYVDCYLGNLLRVFLLGYQVLALAAIYQLTLPDLWWIQMVAGLVLGGFCFALIGFISFRVIRAGPEKLFTMPRLRFKYGALYSDYRSNLYLFFIPLLAYQIIRAVSICAFQSHPWVQVSIMSANELLYLVAIFFLQPNQLRIANGLNTFNALLRVTNILIIFFFIQTLVVDQTASTIVAYLLIVIQALMILSSALTMVWGLCTTLTRLGKKDKEPSLGSTSHASRPDSPSNHLGFSNDHASVMKQQNLQTPQEYPLMPSSKRPQSSQTFSRHSERFSQVNVPTTYLQASGNSNSPSPISYPVGSSPSPSPSPLLFTPEYTDNRLFVPPPVISDSNLSATDVRSVATSENSADELMRSMHT